MSTIGARIAANGWLQGSVLRDDDLRSLSERYSFKMHRVADVIGLVVSQSCDLTYDWLEGEPCAELLLGLKAETEDAIKKRGNCTGGKHPRCLHMPIQYGGSEVWFEFVPWNRFAVDRTAFLDITPDHERNCFSVDLDVVTNWLAQRYIRAAFPDDFNDLLEAARKKQKKLHERLSPDVSGLYAQISPDRDLRTGERYSVNLLALVPDSHETQRVSVHETVEKLAALMRLVDMEVLSAVALESEISYATVRSYRRFPLEQLSLRSDPLDPMPFV